jgi:hypothetical protein
MIEYRLYANTGVGDPVDLATPIGTTSGLTFDTAPLSYPSDWTFLVRAYDTVLGIEEANVDARVRIVLDAAGLNITGRPNAIGNLTVRAGVAGAIRPSWTYSEAGQGGAPTGFKVWRTLGASVNYAVAPDLTIPYVRGSTLYETSVPGGIDGTTYSIGVRAYNAISDDGNTLSVTITADSTGPDAVDDFAGSIVSGL